ncbi:hypothetical protein CVT24_011049 [Panaeolus cyanescens]|uniref:F-box domain-containing protein n=1 Tax=Panaeolus cyanescens TaxID=181874 RepID=A0A409VFX2_9AGAR|nr:hypothetical protein CVT24_011049 [Panaeolus cyanescens]
MPESPKHTVQSCNQVPMELIDLIIGHLRDDSQSFVTDLKACSLVARSWVPVCRAYLFKEVHIVSSAIEPHSMDRYKQLAALIKQNQTIAKFIRSIQFITILTVGDVDIASVESLDNHFPVISQTSEVRSLDITIEGGRKRYQTGTAYFGWCYLLDWYLSTKQLTTISLTGIDEVPILSILLAPQLTTLNITGCYLASTVEESSLDLRSQHSSFALENLKAHFITGFSSSLLGLCTRLRVMDLYSVAFTGSNNTNELALPAFPRLASLEVGSIDGWDLSEGTHCVADGHTVFPAVTSFKVLCPLESKFPRFRTLQSLSLIYDGSDYAFDWSELSQLVNDSLPHLTHLQLAIHAEEDAEPILESIQKVLSPHNGVNVIRSFELELHESLGDVEDWWDTSENAWTQLGNTLSSASDFPCLRKASISLEIGCANGDESDESLMSEVLKGKGCSDFRSVLSGPLEALIAREEVEVHYEVDITF